LAWFEVLTPWSSALLEKPPVVYLLTNFPKFHVTRRFVTVFTKSLHWFLSWDRSIQSIPPHPTSLAYILILYSYARLGPPGGLFPSSFPHESLRGLSKTGKCPSECWTEPLSHEPTCSMRRTRRRGWLLGVFNHVVGKPVYFIFSVSPP
jgi:hypothetical protein